MVILILMELVNGIIIQEAEASTDLDTNNGTITDNQVI